MNDSAAETKDIRAKSSEIPRVFGGPFCVGEVLAGTYEIRRVLGAGGMGIVYEAEDLQLRRKVAIKVAARAAYAPALAAEARALAAIHHPGVVSVFAMGKHEGYEFLVLERLYGRSLQARIEENQKRKRDFSIAEVVEILVGVADALSAAHRAGIAHRDLKPGNVLLAGGRTVLVDFGLFVPEIEVAHAQRAAVSGTVEFLAPEVIRRKVVPGEGPLIDLYALGIIAYELLVGHTPFVSNDAERMMRDHVESVPPSSGSTRSDVPAELAKLVDELLSKEPLERPASAEEVLWRLSSLRAPGLGAGIRPFRVLVIDDDPAIASILRRTLKLTMPQLVVETETDPRSAMAEIERTPPDLVLLDVNMPQMNGVEVAMEIVGLPEARRPRIVVTSALASDSDVELLRTLGAEAFVPKDERLLARLAAVLTDLRSA